MTGCVVVFGREPVPGCAKSRLAAVVGGRAAARVYATLLDNTLEAASASGVRVVLSLAAGPSSGWVAPPDVAVEIQRGELLGDRLADAFDRRFSEGERRVVVVGSDCPWITPEHVSWAAAELSTVDAVLGPTADGGYWMLAQRPPGLALFERVPWSHPETLERTRQRMIELGATWSELEQMVDIDTFEDLDLVLADPRTRDPLRERLKKALDPKRG